MSTAHAFIFNLHYRIFTTPEEITPVNIHLPAAEVVFHRPFRAEPVQSPRQAILARSIPQPTGGPSLESTIGDLPVLQSRSWQAPHVAGDSLRIDVVGPERELAQQIAESAAAAMLRLIRLRTRQWWILRGSEESLSPLIQSFPVDNRGFPVGDASNPGLGIISRLGSETLLDQGMLAWCAQVVEEGGDSPPTAQALLDAAFYWMHSEPDRALLDAIVACELLFAELLYFARDAGTITRGEVKRWMRRDLPEKTGEGTRKVLKQCFAEEVPIGQANIRSLWKYRHASAHGNPALRRHFSTETSKEGGAAIRGAFAFIEWLSARTAESDVAPLVYLVPQWLRADRLEPITAWMPEWWINGHEQ